jgi:hypothetical protein
MAPRHKTRKSRNSWYAALRAHVAALAQRRGPIPDITVATIMSWADAHHARTGEWPHRDSGCIRGSGGETWFGIEAALTLGLRGLPGHSTIPRFLAS